MKRVKIKKDSKLTGFGLFKNLNQFMKQNKFKGQLED